MQVFPQARPLRQIRQQLDGVDAVAAGPSRVRGVNSMVVEDSVQLRSMVVVTDPS